MRTKLSGLVMGSLIAIVLATAFGQGVRGVARLDATPPNLAQVEVSPSPDTSASPTPSPDVTPTPTTEPTPSPSFFSFPVDLFVSVVWLESESQIRHRTPETTLAGWRIEAAFDGATVSFAQPVTERVQKGDIAEAYWALEALEPTIGVTLTAIPPRGYRPVRARCGGGIPIAFEGNTITFTHGPLPPVDLIACTFSYIGPPQSRPDLPPTDTMVEAQQASSDGSGHLPLVFLAAVAGVLFLSSRRAATRRE